MKHLLFTISLITLAFCGKAQTDNKVVIGTIDSIQSKILNEKRKIWVYVPPDDGTSEKYAKQRFPVVYLLDGDAHFLQVVSMIQLFNIVWDNAVCPNMIVVGILNTDRNRDLTPTHVTSDSTSGGGEKFISFIEKELMPYIDSQYPTEPYKMLEGHSFGGLAVMQTFVHHTNLFNSYICIDPSLWWDNQSLLKESEKALANNKFQETSLFLGIANTMDVGMDINKVSKDTSDATIHIRSILELRNALESNKKNGLQFQSKYYSDESHGTVTHLAEYDALRFIFKDYVLKLPRKDFIDSTTDLLDKCKQHYAKISKQMGYEVRPPGKIVNELGYSALFAKQYKKAGNLFKYNLDSYPGSYKVYVAMGDYCAAVGDTSNAIINYKKSLSIEEIADIRKKLEKVQGK